MLLYVEIIHKNLTLPGRQDPLIVETSGGILRGDRLSSSSYCKCSIATSRNKQYYEIISTVQAEASINPHGDRMRFWNAMKDKIN